MKQEITQPRIDPASVPGWAVDADPENDPTWPMRNRENDDAPGMNWERPPLQEDSVEILHSIEHNRTPAVFGTATPPRGISGMIRRSAFKYSESQWAHWLLLMAADRVDMIEGVVEDFSRGKAPDLYKEYGLASEWQTNRKQFVTRTATTVALTAGAAALAYYLLKPKSAVPEMEYVSP